LGDAERDEDLSGFPGRGFLPRYRKQLIICRLIRFLTARRFESKDQPIPVHINAEHLLGNHAAIVRVRSAGSWLAVLGDKVLIHRFDNDVFNVGCWNAGDRYRLGLSIQMHVRCRRQKAIDEVGPGIGFDLAPLKVVQMPAKAVSGRSSLSANQTAFFFSAWGLEIDHQADRPRYSTEGLRRSAHSACHFLSID
jgi:hypothetical protein